MKRNCIYMNVNESRVSERYARRVVDIFYTNIEVIMTGRINQNKAMDPSCQVPMP